MSTALSAEILDPDEQSADLTGLVRTAPPAAVAAPAAAADADEDGPLDEFPPALQFEWTGESVAEPGTQAEVLAAWVRIVLELYLRDESVATWSIGRMREAVNDPILPPDARALLGVCLDEVRRTHLFAAQFAFRWSAGIARYPACLG